MNKAEITDKKLLEHLDSIEKDGMTIFVMADGQFRGAFFNGTRLVNQMRANMNLEILETYILAQAELCAALLIPTMKGKEQISLTYETDGICKGFSVEADSTGFVRGHLFQESIPLEKPLENWDLTQFFGNGTLTIRRLGEGMKEAVTSSVEIVHKNIALDLAYYFEQSEQIHTAFNTSVKFDNQGRIVGAGGLFLQVVPEAGGKSKVSAQNVQSGDEFASDVRDELIGRVENALQALPSIGTWFSENGNRKDIVYGLFREFNPVAVLDRDIIYDCPCHLEKYVDAVKRFPKNQLDELINEDKFPLEIVCSNCGSKYDITKEMLLNPAFEK